MNKVGFAPCRNVASGNISELATEYRNALIRMTTYFQLQKITIVNKFNGSRLAKSDHIL